MKNKKILALAIASVLGLTACGEDSTALRIDDTIKDSLNRQSSIAFDLISSTKVISTPTYLVMDTSDGTLNIPVDPKDDQTRANPAIAMGDTDGWSPTQPFVIKLDLPTGVTLTTDSTLLHAAVKVAKVTVTNYVMSDLEALTAGDGTSPEHDYTVISDGTSLTVLPLKGSLEHGSDYIYAITDALIDSSGEKLGMSTSYAALKNKQIDQTGGSLDTPQKIVLQVEGLMDGYGIADYENIIYSSWFTTSSAGEALYAVKGATAKVLGGIFAQPVLPVGAAVGAVVGAVAGQVWQGSANPNSIPLTDLYTLQPPTSVMSLGNGISLHKGIVKLPSFLERDITDNKWYTTPWQSGMPSLAIISSTLNSDAERDNLLGQMADEGLSPSDLVTNPLGFVGKSFTKIDGSPLDSERLITKYSPLPQIKNVEEVKYVLITPDGANAGSVPVVIYQHGITSIKENLLASLPLTGNLNKILNENYAVLAIDLPLHGERALADGAIIADEDNAGVFMNFGYLPVGRDNLRQAVADLIGLRAGLNLIQLTPGSELDVLDTSNVSFFGHSLGAMTGISLQATIDRKMPSGNELFEIKKAVFSNPGGGVPYLLLNSVGFSGTVKHGLMTASDSLDEDSSGYVQFTGLNCTTGQDTACFNGYYDYIETVKPGTQAVINATFQSFAVAAQTVLETADPFAVARDISADTPVYLAQVKDDMVIPNSLAPGAAYAAPYSPIGGTTPLIAQMKLINIGTDNTGSKKVALLNAGEHSSAIVNDPSNPFASAEITAELQSQISSFLAGDGTAVTILDTNLLD